MRLAFVINDTGCDLFSRKKKTERTVPSHVSHNTGIHFSRKQVVSLSYLLMFVLCCCSALVFLLSGWGSQSLLHFSAAVVALVGLGIVLKGSMKLARDLFPVVCAIYVALCSFLFYGSGSDFEWFLVTLPAYSVTAFQIHRYKAQFLVCVLASFTFLYIDVFAPTDMLLQSEDLKLMMSFMTFVVSMSIIALITGVVVSRLHELNDHLRDLAEVDELTKINNRRKVLSEAVNVFADAVINHQKCSFAIVDLDHFKQINDSYGHDVGDKVLYQCAQAMNKSLRRGDWLGRYGGEEFVVIMPNTSLNEAVLEMERLRVRTGDVSIEHGEERYLHVSVSIGVASILKNTERYEEILARADKALYQAKRNGRNRVEYDPG